MASGAVLSGSAAVIMSADPAEEVLCEAVIVSFPLPGAERTKKKPERVGEGEGGRGGFHENGAARLMNGWCYIL